MSELSNKTYKVNIDFRQIGLKKLDKELAKIQTELPHIQNALKSLGTNNSLTKTFETSFKQLEKNIGAVAKLKKTIMALSSDNPTVVAGAASQFGITDYTKYKDIYLAATKQIDNIAKKILQTKANFRALEQASLNYFSVLKTSSKDYITILEKLGLKEDTITQLSLKQKQIYASATKMGNIKPLQTYNNSLKNRVLLLDKIQQKEQYLSSTTLPKTITTTIYTKIEQLKKSLNDLSTPLSTIQTKFSTLIPDSYIKKAEKLRIINNDFIKTFKKLGISSKVLTKMRVNLDAILKTYLKTGNSAQLDRYINSLKTRETILRETKVLQDKVNASLATEIEKEQALKNIKIATSAAKDINTSKQDLVDKYNAATSAVNNLSKALQQQAKLENESRQLLQKYEQELTSLERIKKIKSLWATPQNKKEANEAIKSLKIMISKVQEYRNTLNTVEGKAIVSTPKGFKQSEANLTELKNSLNGVIVKSREAKASLSNMGLLQVAKRTAAYASAYAGFYQVIQAFKSGINFAVEFDKNIHVMSAVFDINIMKAKQLQKGLVDLGRTYGGDIKNINEAALALGRAGLAAKDVVKATEIVIKMAKLTGDTIGVSSNALITYKQDFEDATHPISVLGDQLAYVANQSRLSTQDIGTFSNYALASAKAAGLSVEAINAMAISLSNAGVNASTIGTEIRRFSFLLKDSSSVVQKFFISLGTSQQILASKIRYSTASSNKAILDLINKASSMSNEAFSKSLQGMDIRAAEVLTLLRNNSESFKAHFKDLLNGVNGELDKSNYIASSYASTWERVKNSMGSAFTALSNSSFKKANVELLKLNDILIKISNNSDKFSNNFIHYTKIIGDVVTSLFLIKGVKTISEGITATISKLLPLLEEVEGSFAKSKVLITEIFSIMKKLPEVATDLIESHPKIAILVAIAGALYLSYTHLNNTSKVVKQINQTQQAMNNQIRIESKLHKEQLNLAQQQLDLAKAIHENNQSEIDKLTTSIALTNVKITKLLTQKNIINSTVIALEKQNKLLSLQDKVKSLQIEKNIELKLHTTEAKNRIKQINEQLSKLKTTITLKITTNDKQNTSDALNKMKTALYVLKNSVLIPTDLKNSLIAKLTNQIQIAENHLATLNKSLTKVKKQTGIQGLFTVTNKDVQNFTQLQRAILSLYNMGENVDKLKATTKQTLQHSINAYSTTIKTILTKSLNDLKVNTGVLNTLPKNVKDTLQTVVQESNHLTTLKGISNFNADLENLSILLNNTDVKNPKALNILKSIISSSQKGSSKLQQLITSFKKLLNIGKLDKTKLEFTPFDQTASANSYINNIDKAYTSLIEKKKQLANLTSNRITHINKLKLLEIELKQNSQTEIEYGTKYNTLILKRKQLIKEIKKLDGTGTITAQKEKTKKLKDLDNTINIIEKQIYKTELARLNISSKITDNKIKEAETIQKINLETKAMRDKLSNTVVNPYIKYSSNVKKELNYNPNNSNPNQKPRANAYFNNMRAYIDTEKYNVKQKQQSSEVPINYGQNMAYYAKIRDDAKQNAMTLTADKLNYLKNEQQLLREQEQAGYISEAEYKAKMNASEIEMLKTQTETIQNIHKARISATIGLYGAATSSLGTSLDNLQKSGVIKSKKAFRAMKALQVTAAISSTYLAVTEALAAPPGPPWSYVGAAAALAAGMAQVAQIKAQKFHTGGYVSGQQSGSMGGLRDDEIPAILKKNEYVLTQKDVKSIKSSNNVSTKIPTQTPIKHETVIINSIDPSVIDEWATSRQGREIIRNVVNA